MITDENQLTTVKIGLIGKTNTGKTTFYNSATTQSAEMSNYPFTTKSPNTGVGHAATLCVHRELGVKQDNPKNSTCIDGWRIVTIEIIDLPGLIKGAWEGRGLGNQFLSIAAQSDALLHIVDASGSVDAEGKIASPGKGDPVADIADIEDELAMWYLKLFENSFDKIVRILKTSPMTDFAQTISEQMQQHRRQEISRGRRVEQVETLRGYRGMVKRPEERVRLESERSFKAHADRRKQDGRSRSSEKFRSGSEKTIMT